MRLILGPLVVTIGSPPREETFRATCLCVEDDDTKIWSGPWRKREFTALLDEIHHEYSGAHHR
jgi:hypothetical protein